MRNLWLAPYRPLDVRAFLERIRSPRLDDMPWLPETVINAAQLHDINPRWLLTLIQKEQSGLTLPRLSEHAQKWLLGFGKTEGPEYPQFAGAANQVMSAARGLRRYLTPGDRLFVGGLVGQQRTFDGARRTVRNYAEAAALRYTPHWSALDDHVAIYCSYFGDEEEVMARTADVARVAKHICHLFEMGYRGRERVGEVSFNLSETAMCSRFVRECCEAAADTPEHGPLTEKYFGGTARETEEKLQQHAELVADWHDARPGDVICFNAGKVGAWGHIGIYLGDDLFAENTSSAKRGPGFVISTLDEIGHERVSGLYHLPEFTYPETGSKAARLVVVLPGHENVMEPLFHGDEHWVRVRDVARAFDRELVDHRADDGKLYLAEKKEVD